MRQYVGFPPFTLPLQDQIIQRNLLDLNTDLLKQIPVHFAKKPAYGTSLPHDAFEEAGDPGVLIFPSQRSPNYKDSACATFSYSLNVA